MGALLASGMSVGSAMAKGQEAAPDAGADRTFRFTYSVEIPAQPAGAGPIEVFVPLATSDSHQDVLHRELKASIRGKEQTEDRYGNRFWHGRLDRSDGKPITVEVEYMVHRHVFQQSRLATAGMKESPEERKELALWLGPDRLVPVAGPLIDQVRADIAWNDSSPLARARAVYDYVIDHMEYKKVGTGWGNGDTFWACNARYGNCTDFHALFISLARAEQIPARFEIGFSIPEDRPSGDIGGYHCWAEFHLPGVGWFPIDASEAWKRKERRDLYFGTHPADRIQFTVGRDLELGEGHTTGPLNYFIYPHVEVAGEQVKDVKSRFRFADITGNQEALVPEGPAVADPAVGKDAQELRRATFEVRNDLKVIVPKGARRLRVWFAMPQNDPAQTISDLRIDAPYASRVEKDSEGNTVVYLEAENPQENEMTVRESFVLTRSEVRSGVDATKARPLSDSDRANLEQYLRANKHVVVDDYIRQLADQIVGNESNPVLAARKLYDWVLQNVDYWVKDPKTKKASPVGSTTYCLIFRTGNCTDFESLWTSLARAKGIPTRIVYGSFFKPDLNQQDLDQSYHCWAQFYAPGLGWVPHDVAVADLYAGEYSTGPDNEVLVRRTTADGTYGNNPARVDYYFGNLDERRVTWSIGRDLILSPKQDGEPVNALPKAYVEIDGKVHPEGKGWVRKLTYRER